MKLLHMLNIQSQVLASVEATAALSGMTPIMNSLHKPCTPDQITYVWLRITAQHSTAKATIQPKYLQGILDSILKVTYLLARIGLKLSHQHLAHSLPTTVLGHLNERVDVSVT